MVNAILKPHPAMFRQQPMPKYLRKLREKQKVFIPTKARYPKEGGIYIYFLGKLHPEKGMAYPDTMNDLNILKKISLSFLWSLSTRNALGIIIGFVFTPWNRRIKLIERFLLSYLEGARTLVYHHYLHKRWYSPIAKELRTLVYLFLKYLGFSQPVCSEVSDIAMNFVQYDDMYYYKIGDIFSLTTKQKLLDNPRKEINRVFKIYASREHADSKKLGSIGKILSLALLHPKTKKAFKDAVKKTDIVKLQADEADRYNSLLRGKYDFMGASAEHRNMAFVRMHQIAGHVQLPPIQEIETNG